MRYLIALVGGLVFDAAPFMPDTTRAPPNTMFTLYNDRTAAMTAPDAPDPIIRTSWSIIYSTGYQY